MEWSRWYKSIHPPFVSLSLNRLSRLAGLLTAHRAPLRCSLHQIMTHLWDLGGWWSNISELLQPSVLCLNLWLRHLACRPSLCTLRETDSLFNEHIIDWSFHLSSCKMVLISITHTFVIYVKHCLFYRLGLSTFMY